MAQQQEELSCGCIWRGDEHHHQCVAWRDLVERLDRVRAHPDAERELRRIEERMDRHKP